MGLLPASPASMPDAPHSPPSGSRPYHAVVTLRYAAGLPVVGEFGDPAVLLDLAVAAEENGWDGVYLWDHLLYSEATWPVANPVVCLAAIAARTTRVRLGILMTALPRRRVQ